MPPDSAILLPAQNLAIAHHDATAWSVPARAITRFVLGYEFVVEYG